MIIIPLLAGRQSESLNKQLEDAKVQVTHLKHDMETLRRKSMAEIERADRLAHVQRDALEREMSDKMADAETFVSEANVCGLTT